MSLATIQERKTDLIRKGLSGSVFIAPITATAITKTNLFDPTTGDLVALPAGYVDLGWLSTDGAKLSQAIKTSEIDAWGSQTAVRTDIVSKVPTMAVTALETSVTTMELYTGQNIGTITPGANGAFSIQPPSNPTTKFFRVLAVAVDTGSQGEFVIARFFPNASVTALDDQSLANGDDAIEWGVTFTAYPDTVLQYPEDYIVGGAAALAMASDVTVPRSVTITTNSTTAVTATTGSFFPSDVGHALVAAGIPTSPQATIQTWTDATHVVLTGAATASATGVAGTVI